MVITRDEAAAAQNTTERLVDLQEPGTSANGQRPQGAQPRPLMMQPAAETSGFFLLGSEVSRVGLRMPEFTPTDPELWFSIIDRSFHASGITADATKFGYALTTLGPRYTLEAQPRNDPVSMEAKLELRLAQMRLALQQEMSEQLSAIRRSINEIGENRRAYRDRSGDRRRPRSHSRSRSGSRGQSASGICWCH
ncbi:hypothetical protein X777_13269 [Ooceraea biroi]|uniref:DUF7041 domain-containing protein n=1 Tax=Ooceraea biroi TaxID=2015173 RepID=A0A026VXW9_OOCBI|nr:hypothetical protein X777_13269 [Ooceraea biroi]